eukprot:TRINITY_DN8186_c0_g1_i2.p1 TRINITY_DN8186_c0_g1~~TRINITY_DN8186_c0_g1_i2.p1  ORF type:complete len:203 (+),score=34.19 TRINITY_DN8186_c0_g1_i2:76-684(+)
METVGQELPPDEQGRGKQSDQPDAQPLTLDQRMAVLSKEMIDLRERMDRFEEDNHRDSWGVRYSRRMAITSNFLLALWVALSRIAMYLRKQKKSRLIGVVVPLGSTKRTRNDFNHLVLETALNAARKSWLFLVASLLLSSHSPLKRQTGLYASTAYSLYLVFFEKFLPLTNYFNIFTNLLYITVAWNSRKPGTSFRNFLKNI